MTGSRRTSTSVGSSSTRRRRRRRGMRTLLRLLEGGAVMAGILLLLPRHVDSYPDPCTRASHAMMMEGSNGTTMTSMMMGELYGMCGNYTFCSASGNLTCADANRTCVRDADDDSASSSDNGMCGNCLAGYVDVSSWNGTTLEGCKSVEDVTFEMYEAAFHPQYGAEVEYNVPSIDDARRSQLRSNLLYVSEARARIPPLLYAVLSNKYSADLPPDYQGLAGHNTLLNASVEVGFEPSQTASTRNRRRVQQSSSSANLPSEVDWVAAGAVTYVKNQGRCGCCWSISCMGAVEGSTFITNTYIDSLSFQQLVSCDTQNDGCQGGNIAYALQYAVSNTYGGLTLYDDYPFEDSDGTTTTTCGMAGMPLDVEVFEPVVVVSYGQTTSSLSARVQSFKEAVASQPVSITMNANCDTFNSYAGGILTDDGDCSCSDVSCIDHAILIVGYNDTYSPPYWIIKNSWGTDWGDQGYFLVAQEGGGDWGLFGILGEGVIPLKADNTTGQVAEAPTSDGVVWKYNFDAWRDATRWMTSWGLRTAMLAMGWIM